MTTPTSGQISLSEVRTTFKASGQVSFSDFYAAGTYLADTVTGAGGAIPTSGQISLSDFYSPLTGTLAGYFTSINDVDASFSNESNYVDGSDSTFMGYPSDLGFDHDVEVHTLSSLGKLHSDVTLTNLKVEHYGRITNVGNSDGTVYWDYYPNYDVSISAKSGLNIADGTGGGPYWRTLGDGGSATWGDMTMSNILLGLRTTSFAANTPRFRANITGTGVSQLSTLEAYNHKITATFTYA